MSGYWAILGLAAIEGGVRIYRIRAERRTVVARLRAAEQRRAVPRG
jgi:hypothetical protein